MIYFQRGSVSDDLALRDLEEGLYMTFDQLRAGGRILAIPPDYTRRHSFAGEITSLCNRYYGDRLTDILPALGTHVPMTSLELEDMYPGIPVSKFKIHNWREDILTLGEVPGEFVSEISEGRVDFPWPAQVNSLLIEGGFDLILSIGQVVPHEVVGMANHSKNIFIGAGGPEGINKSHFLGAVYGMERMMGRTDTPVRKILDYASQYFAGDLPLLYVLTVVGLDRERKPKVRGLFIGDDAECFEKAAELSLRVNFQMLEEPLEKVVVYLDPSEFKSTWLGNKSIYRTRMAIADGGDLVVLAPGVKTFGEDPGIDHLIRKYGYRTTPEIMESVSGNEDLDSNLGAAAHLIHGSSEGRFNITYCPGHLSRQEIENSGFRYAGLEEMIERYDPAKLAEGWNSLPDGEKIFFISNPALGLWASRERFEQS